MFSICKSAVRGVAVLGVVAGLAAGGTMLIAGPDRAKAIFDEMHEGVLDHIDASIDDPTAMRQQLLDLEKEYPKRIRAVRTDLAELREQIRQLEHEQKVAAKVVALADRDLAELEPLLAQARDARAELGDTQLVSVRWGGGVYEFDRAVSRANQIKQTRTLYSGRSADAAHDLNYMRQQAQRLEDLAIQLETERAEFQTQIKLLERQVDAIARNERLIELLDERNKTIEECSRFEAISLEHLTGRLAEIRSRQEAELDMLANSQKTMDYEERAEQELVIDETFEDEPEEPESENGVAVTRVWEPVVIEED